MRDIDKILLLCVGDHEGWAILAASRDRDKLKHFLVKHTELEPADYSQMSEAERNVRTYTGTFTLDETLNAINEAEHHPYFVQELELI